MDVVILGFFFFPKQYLWREIQKLTGFDYVRNHIVWEVQN